MSVMLGLMLVTAQLKHWPMTAETLKNVEKKTNALYFSCVFFMQFLGELISRTLRHGNRIVWRKTLLSNLRAGSSMVVPLILISILIGITMALSIHLTLSRFHLQQQAMLIAQTTMLKDIAPIPIAFILCVHCGLNLIEKDHPSLHLSPQVVMLETIIPLFMGINATALLLYTYVFTSFLVSTYLTSNFVLHLNTNEYLLQLGTIISPLDLLGSLLKALFFSSIASLIAGYYYYGVAKNILSTRLAVSRIITRSLFWIVVISVTLKLLIP